MAQKKSEFLGAWGKAFQIFKAIVDAILASGGSDEDVARLETLAPHIATMVIAARPPKPVVKAYPAVGEVFELTLDGDAPENQPLEIVRYFGNNPEGWKHKGLRVGGKQTCLFMLVQVGYCLNLEVVQERLKAYGKNPGGQWMKAFKVAYPQPDGKGPVGISDASWIYPSGDAVFPFVNTGGYVHFYSIDDVRDTDWRWIVVVE